MGLSDDTVRAPLVTSEGFGRDVCGALPAAERREWLVTKGRWRPCVRDRRGPADGALPRPTHCCPRSTAGAHAAAHQARGDRRLSEHRVRDIRQSLGRRYGRADGLPPSRALPQGGHDARVDLRLCRRRLPLRVHRPLPPYLSARASALHMAHGLASHASTAPTPSCPTPSLVLNSWSSSRTSGSTIGSATR